MEYRNRVMLDLELLYIRKCNSDRDLEIPTDLPTVEKFPMHVMKHLLLLHTFCTFFPPRTLFSYVSPHLIE